MDSCLRIVFVGRLSLGTVIMISLKREVGGGELETGVEVSWQLAYVDPRFVPDWRMADHVIACVPVGLL